MGSLYGESKGDRAGLIYPCDRCNPWFSCIWMFSAHNQQVASSIFARRKDWNGKALQRSETRNNEKSVR